MQSPTTTPSESFELPYVDGLPLASTWRPRPELAAVERSHHEPPHARHELFASDTTRCCAKYSYWSPSPLNTEL